MADTLLIPPDNRLLGWSLTDLTLYGGQPTAGMVIGRADDGSGTSIAPPAAPPATGAAPASTEGDVAARETTALLDDSANQPAVQPIPAAATVPAIHTPAATTADHAPSVPAPTGSGSFVDPPLATPLQVANDHAADGAGGPASAAEAAFSPTPVTAPLNVATAAVDAIAAPVAGIAETLAPVIAPLADVADALAPVTAALPPVAATVDTLAQTAAALPETVIGALAETQAVVDAIPVESFGGVDPAAGLHTLIGLVEGADAFDLGQAVTAPGEATGPASILDALAADALPDPLLGDGHDGVTPAGEHVLDDHGIHVGL